MSTDLSKAWILIESGRAQDGLEIATAHLAVYPDNAHAMCLAAIALMSLRKLQGASDFAQRAVASAPHSDMTWRIASAAAQELGSWNDALTSARTAISLNPHFWENHRQLARVGIARARVNRECMAAARRAIELAPDAPHAHTTLAVAYLARRRVRAAKRSVSTALELDPQNALAFHLHSLLIIEDNPGAAAAGFANRLAESPTDEAALDAFRRTASVMLGQLQAIAAVVIIFSTPFPSAWVRAGAFVVLIGCVAGYILWLKYHAGPAFVTLVRGLPQLDRSLIVRAAVLAICIALLGASAVSGDESALLGLIAWRLVLLSIVVHWVQLWRLGRIEQRKLKAERASR